MNSIDALKLPSQSSSTVRQKAQPFEQKKDTKQAAEQSVFSKIFTSLSSESQKVNENEKQGKMLKKLEQALKTLQDLPKETLSPEDQDILYEMLHLLSFQMMEMKDKLQGNNQEKLMMLLQQMEQEIGQQSSASATTFGNIPRFVEGEEKSSFIQPDRALKQLQAFVQSFATAQHITEKQQVALKQIEQVEQSLKQVIHIIQELEADQQLVEKQRTTVLQGNVEPPLKSAVNQEGSGLQAEQLQSKENSQQPQGAALDLKGGQTVQRSEPSAQAAAHTVRMNNLIEDLREVLRGSFRLNTNHEGTQVRVNISPDHLGHLDIRLTSSEGKIAAQIFTSSLAAKEVLDYQVNQLRNSLLQQGISIERIEVTHQQQSFGQHDAHAEQRFSQQQQKQGASSRNKNAYQAIEEEAEVERNHKLDGSVKVNYTI